MRTADLTGGNPVVMLPGRLTRWKGQVNFIKAIAMLNRTDVRCLLVGGSQGRKDYRKELVAFANSSKGPVVRRVMWLFL